MQCHAPFGHEHTVLTAFYCGVCWVTPQSKISQPKGLHKGTPYEFMPCVLCGFESEHPPLLLFLGRAEDEPAWTGDRRTSDAFIEDAQMTIEAYGFGPVPPQTGAGAVGHVRAPSAADRR